MDQIPLSSNDRSSRSAHFFSAIHRYKNLLRRWWWVMPLFMVIGSAIQIARMLTAPPQYISTGKMMVSGKIQLPTGSVYSDEMVNFLGTQTALMQSDTVRRRAAERLRALKPELPPQRDVLLQVRVAAKTAIFDLMVVSPDGEYSRAFLDACMDEYTALRKSQRQSAGDTTLAGIQQELVRLEKELKKGEEDILNFQSSNSVVMLNEQGGYASTYLVSLNRKLAEMKSEHQLLKMLDLEQNLELRQAGDIGTLNTETSSATEKLLTTGADYVKAKQQIQVLKAEQEELSRDLRPKHPKMVALADDIANWERLLTIFRAQSSEQLDSRRNSLELQIQNLEREAQEWEIKSLDISRKMAQYQQIKTGIDRNRTQYDNLLRLMQNLNLGNDIDTETVTILEKASDPLPNRANVPKMLLIGIVGGFALGLGLVLLIDRFDDRPTSFTELQDLFDEPVLGQVPQQGDKKQSDRVQPLQPHDDRHAFVEAYRNLRSSLLYMATEGKRPKVLLFTSAVPGDGKSMTTANLAITLAQSGSRVLVVDTDLRKGTIHKYFNTDAQPGLTETLTEGKDWATVVQKASVPNLWIVARGATSRNPGELFLTQNMPKILQAMAAGYDYVILDSAPVMAADDVTTLSPHVEGVVFVIRAGYTSSRVAQAALDLLYQREVDVLGLVFNGVEARASEYYFYKYKDYYAQTSRT